MKCKCKNVREPQSEIEDGKDQTDFEKTVIKEIRKFLDGLRNVQIVQEADISDLQERRATFLN